VGPKSYSPAACAVFAVQAAFLGAIFAIFKPLCYKKLRIYNILKREAILWESRMRRILQLPCDPCRGFRQTWPVAVVDV